MGKIFYGKLKYDPDDEMGKVSIFPQFYKEYYVIKIDILMDWISDLTMIKESMQKQEEKRWEEALLEKEKD